MLCRDYPAWPQGKEFVKVTWSCYFKAVGSWPSSSSGIHPLTFGPASPGKPTATWVCQQILGGGRSSRPPEYRHHCSSEDGPWWRFRPSFLGQERNWGSNDRLLGASTFGHPSLPSRSGSRPREPAGRAGCGVAEVGLDMRGDGDNVGNEGNFPRERGKRRERSLSAQIIIKHGSVIYGERAGSSGLCAPPVAVPCAPETHWWGRQRGQQAPPSTQALLCVPGTEPLCAPSPDVCYLGRPHGTHEPPAGKPRSGRLNPSHGFLMEEPQPDPLAQ